MMRLSICVCALGVALGAEICRGAAAPQETVYVTGPRSTSIPLTISSQGQLFATIGIAGRKLRMLVDTGSPNTSVDKAIALELKLRPEGEERKTAMGATVVGDWCSHSDIKIGDFLIHRCPLRLVDMSATRAGIAAAEFEPFDGFLGVDMLLFLRAKMDFNHRTMQLYRP